MAKNDTIILDAIIDERIHLKLPSEKKDEVFEYFSIEQIVKDLNLSKDEILTGMVDGKNDGGIDGFYIIVNGHLLTDAETFFWPRSSAELEVYIVTCKHHETFKQAPLDSLVATLTEFFDLGIDDKSLEGDYNEDLLRSRELLKTAYKKLSPRISNFFIKFTYASRGETSILGESIISRSKQIINITQQSFGACKSTFQFYGSTELVELNRKVPNFSLELPFQKVLNIGERYVLLSKVGDYNKFVIDENRKLRRYLFDSNVRDFMGLNRVNEDIKKTLEDINSPDFWWLNNGITILATSARVIGNTIHIQDIQIVNGLQTTESIFRFFEDNGTDPNERSVLIKVIVSNEPEIRDSIIRATNNQTLVELSALHATDKIQRDIEDIMLKFGLYYERRNNYYSNQGIQNNLIISPLYLASGFVTLVLKQPWAGAVLKQRFMRSPESYNRVFSQTIPIEIWPKIAKVLRITDSAIEKFRPKKTTITEGFLKKWRQIACFLTVSRLLGTFNYSIQDFISLDITRFSDSEVEISWQFIKASELSKGITNKWRQRPSVVAVLKKASEIFAIDGNDIFIKPKREFRPKDIPKVYIDPKFVEKVDQLLPEQPWKPGTHSAIAEDLNCASADVAAAINELIVSGKRNRQKNGITYDANNNIISIDEERVDLETLELKDGSDFDQF